MKKIFSFLAAVLMAGSTMAETIYCKMEYSWWKAAGAAVGIYAYGPEDVKNANWPGERMTPVEGQADVWSYELTNPENYTAIIFTRVNGSGNIENWGAKTGDLSLEAKGENNLYTITSSTAVWGDPGCDGEWSVYGTEPGPGPEPEPVIDTLYLVNSKGWGAPKIYFYGGKKGQRTAWPGDAMTKVNDVKADGFDVYMFSINHGDHANVIFNNGNGVQSGDLAIAGNEGKYFNFADQTWYESAEAVVCTWYLKANYNGTTEWRELTPAADRKTFARRDVYAAAANYYYNGMAPDNLKSEIKGTKLTIASELAAGDSAVFTLDPYAKTINVTKIEVEVGPEPVITKDTVMYVAGNFTNWAEDMQPLPYTINLPKDSAIEFKGVIIITTTTTVVGQDPVVAYDTTWCGQKTENFVMTRESMTEAGWLLDGDYNVLLTTDVEGEYTFSLTETGSFLVTFPEKVEPVITKDTVMFVAGNFTNWAEEMQVLPYTITLPADSTISFKQVRVITTYTDEVETAKDTTWFGQANEGAYMTRESNTWLLDGEYNVLLTTDAEGEYTFALNEDGQFSVTFPDKTTTGIYNVKDGKAVKMVENGQVVIIKNGIRYDVMGKSL